MYVVDIHAVQTDKAAYDGRIVKRFGYLPRSSCRLLPYLQIPCREIHAEGYLVIISISETLGYILAETIDAYDHLRLILYPVGEFRYEKRLVFPEQG